MAREYLSQRRSLQKTIKISFASWRLCERLKVGEIMNQIERANLFRKLHVPGDPLILFNIWDAGSARAVQDAGAKALATGSWSVAAAHGYKDGETLPLNLVFENLKRIVASVNLPVTLDFESGYGKSPAELKPNIARVIEAGGVGINFEDQIINGSGLYSIDEQSNRIRAIREAADQADMPLYINARTDIFLKKDAASHNTNDVHEAIERASAYRESGASGFFAPGLIDPKFIEKLCQNTTLPVNIMAFPGTPATKELAQLGVARISYGPGPYRQMMKALKEAAEKVLNEK
jgi:2-methylisocitrate lyase-like PEP mutase family enzyme